MADHVPAPSAGAHASAEVEVTPPEHEKPEDWGWHHEFRLGRQVGGWFSVLALLLLMTGWHYNRAGSVALYFFIVTLVAGLLWDRKRQRTQWRK